MTDTTVTLPEPLLIVVWRTDGNGDAEYRAHAPSCRYATLADTKHSRILVHDKADVRRHPELVANPCRHCRPDTSWLTS